MVQLISLGDPCKAIGDIIDVNDPDEIARRSKQKVYDFLIFTHLRQVDHRLYP